MFLVFSRWKILWCFLGFVLDSSSCKIQDLKSHQRFDVCFFVVDLSSITCTLSTKILLTTIRSVEVKFDTDMYRVYLQECTLGPLSCPAWSKSGKTYTVIFKDDLRWVDFVYLSSLSHYVLCLCDSSLREQPPRRFWDEPVFSVFNRERELFRLDQGAKKDVITKSKLLSKASSKTNANWQWINIKADLPFSVKNY